MLPERWVRRLSALTRAQVKAWNLIAEYVKTTCKCCFTYNQIMRFWRDARERINALTLDRRLRELAQMGVLERRQAGGRRRTLYCVNAELCRALAGAGGCEGHRSTGPVHEAP